MNAHVTVLAFVAACLAAPTGRQQNRTEPHGDGAAVFEIALWPGEGRPRLIAGATRLVPRAAPRLDAPPAPALHVKKGQPLEFGQTLYRTTIAGRLKVLKDAVIAGRRFGRVVRVSREDYYSDRHAAASLPVRVGEFIAYLQPRAESACIVRVRDEIVEADPCPHLAFDSGAAFALEAEPRIEWWVELQVDGRPAGWSFVDGRTVREKGRTFDAGCHHLADRDRAQHRRWATGPAGNARRQENGPTGWVPAGGPS